jgi:hypothetical protein
LQDSRNNDDALRAGGEDLGEVFEFDSGLVGVEKSGPKPM